MKLVAPSYLVPGTWLENLEAVAPVVWIEGIELLFFSYDDEARAILDRERAGIASFAGRFEFSLHLPDPLGPADEELIERTRPFVGLYVAHPPKSPDASAAQRWATLLSSWRPRYGDVFCLEYTGREAFEAAERGLSGLPLCPDTGRLALDGEDAAGWIADRADRVAEIHLHAARGGKDHFPLSADDPWLSPLARLAADREWRVVLETFSLDGATESANALRASTPMSEAAR